MFRIFPDSFFACFFVGLKKSAKFLPNFQEDFPTRNQRSHRLFFCRRDRRRKVTSTDITHTGNKEVTVQVTLACYSRPGQVARCSHSSVVIHPWGGSKTKLRFVALPGSSIWPRLPLGAGLRKDVGSLCGGQFARLTDITHT